MPSPTVPPKNGGSASLTAPGKVLSEFGSGLYPGSPDDLYLADFSYTQGLLYFVYYPDGTSVSETAMRCYIDARPDHDHTVQVVE